MKAGLLRFVKTYIWVAYYSCARLQQLCYEGVDIIVFFRCEVGGVVLMCLCQGPLVATYYTVLV